MSDDIPAPDSTIAVIGMSCRFPQAATPAAFWRNLREGRDCIVRYSHADLMAAGTPAQTLDDPAYIRAKGQVEGVEQFDGELFGFSPREAAILDPRCRLLLECGWEALEAAGYLDASVLTGAFFGIGASIVEGPAALGSYYFQNLHGNEELRRNLSGLSLALACDESFYTAQVAYRLGLTGPCLSVQTACSSSLVAVHLACQSLLFGDCDLALAGGPAQTCPRAAGYWYRAGMTLSPDGDCRPFDSAAHGTVPGEGAGIVVLKRWQDAIDDGDSIDAVILATAVNNDGRRKVGFAAPGLEGQRAVIARALELAGVSPQTIGYVEAHGTGTRLGDPIEVEALTQAFRERTDACEFCGIGSVKSNLGHLDAAAGIAGLIKSILAVQHRELPPTLHLKQPNPIIPFRQSPFFVATDLQPWPSASAACRSIVSSMGMGGTNAIVVLQRAPLRTSAIHRDERVTLFLSAHTSQSLRRFCEAVAGYLESHTECSLRDVAGTLARGRRLLRYRVAVSVQSHKEASLKLAELASRAPDEFTPPASLAADASSSHSETVEQTIRIWLTGRTVDFAAVYPDRSFRRIHLPTLPFDRRRHWVDPSIPPRP